MLKSIGKQITRPLQIALTAGGSILLIYLLWTGYSFIFDRGVASMTPKVTAAEDELKQYKAKYERWVTDSEDAARKTQEANQRQLDQLQAQLDAARATQDERKETTREIIRYVPAEVDERTVLPMGFIRLYSETLQGADAATADLGPFTDGPTGNAGAPSGISLSAFANIIRSNNLTCVSYREHLTLWQQQHIAAQSRYDALERQYQALLEEAQLYER